MSTVIRQKTLPRGQYVLGDPCYMDLPTWFPEGPRLVMGGIDDWPWQDDSGHMYTIDSGCIGIVTWDPSNAHEFGFSIVDGKITSRGCSARLVQFTGSSVFCEFLEHDQAWYDKEENEGQSGMWMRVSDGIQTIVLTPCSTT